MPNGLPKWTFFVGLVPKMVFHGFSLFFNCFFMFFHGVSSFFQRTGFQRTGNPSIFIVGHPSMNINGHPSMNMVPFLWAPFFEPMGPPLGPMGPGPREKSE